MSTLSCVKILVSVLAFKGMRRVTIELIVNDEK